MVVAGFSKSSSQIYGIPSIWRVLYTRAFKNPNHMTCIEQLTHDIENVHLPCLTTVIVLLPIIVKHKSGLAKSTGFLANISRAVTRKARK